MGRVSLKPFVRPMHWGALLHHGGVFLLLIGAVLVVPALAAAAFGEWTEAALMSGTAAGMAGCGVIARRGPAPALERREAVALAAGAYLVAAAAGAVAFLGVAGPVDAFFESMSGFTTTGLTVMDAERLPRSLLLLRGLSQWVGGGGVIVLSLVVLTGPGSAAARLYEAEGGGRGILATAMATGRIVTVVYVALTVVGCAALLLAGAGAFDGLLHSLALLSTGGFSPFGDSIGSYGSPALEAVTILFMVLGAASFPLYYLAARRDWRRVLGDVQLAGLLLLAVVGSAGFFALERGGSGALASAFHGVSALTTTGFTVTDPSGWSDGGRMLVVGLMAVGGSVGSTAGGLKLLRVIILLRLLGWAVTRMLLPREAKVPLKVQRAAVSEDEIRHTFALVAAYLLLLFASGLALTVTGAGFADAVFDSASALGTVGLSVGVASADLAGWAKMVLAVDMWAGRLEILALLVLFHPYNWHR